jgi:hypothetical protein
MNAIAKTSQPGAAVSVLTPRTFEQLVTFADLAAQSGMVPKDYINKPGAIMVAVQMGSELGLSPMQSLNSIAVISGRPGVFGDGLIGLCRQSPLCQDIVETFEGEGESRAAVCVATRRGSTPTKARFSVADAKKAGLWGKAGPWTQYPDRMLQNRARGFALRDAFPDLLRGLKTVEELRDTPPDTYRGTTLDARPEPAATPNTSAAPPDAIPERPATATAKPERTRRMVLDELALSLAAAQTEVDIHLIENSADVKKAYATFKNGLREELDALMGAAWKRVQGEYPEADPDPGAADDVLPGDR